MATPIIMDSKTTILDNIPGSGIVVSTTVYNMREVESLKKNFNVHKIIRIDKGSPARGVTSSKFIVEYTR